MNNQPLIALTMGDAAGIGPEVIVNAAARHDLTAFCTPVVIGDLRRLQRAVTVAEVEVDLEAVQDTRAAVQEVQPGLLPVVDVGGISEDLPFGQLSAEAGEGAYRFIERAAQLAVAHEVDAICTAPLNKEALHAAGHRFPGHTELLAHLTGTPEVSMMLTAPGLRVIHVTTHIGLLDAVDRIDPGLVHRTVRRGHDTLVKAGIEHPRIAVCGINPHAGENGLFGRGEEEKKITPGLEKARGEGI